MPLGQEARESVHIDYRNTSCENQRWERNVTPSFAARPMPWLGVCWSGWLSRSSVVRKRLNISLDFFTLSLSNNSRFSIRRHIRPTAKLRRAPLTAASNAVGYEKVASFRPLYLNNDTRWSTDTLYWNAYRNSYANEWYSDLEWPHPSPRFQGHDNVK